MEVVKRSSVLWSRIRSWVAAISILGLGVLNIATLLDHEVHRIAYNLLQGLIGHLPADTATKVLARSPTSIHQGLVKKLDVQKLKVRAISHRMAPRVGRVAARSLATLPVRVAPFAGTAASLAFTVWELTELCYMMKDLNDLNLIFDGQVGDVDKVCGLKVPFSISSKRPPE